MLLQSTHLRGVKILSQIKLKKMSKDKGVKNIKKAPKDKTLDKKKASDYKSETKSGLSSKSNIDAFKPKP